jgi:hypothetical protein
MGLAPQETVEVGAPIVPTTREVERESTRKVLALVLLGILAIEILAALAAVFFSTAITAAMKDMLGLVFTPTIALVGAATGFGQARAGTTGDSG